MLKIARFALQRSPRRRTGPGVGLLLIFLVAVAPALAQGPAASCEPSVARVVAIQGSVEVQRGGRGDWLPLKKLEAPVCSSDRLRTGPSSRAALFIEPETLVRVDQNTTITVSVTTAEIVVEFFADDVDQAARDAKSCGAGYFITRFPRRFRVSGPHLNAAVEGTEFQVSMQCDATELAVLEGAVRSVTVAAREERTLTAGERLVAGPTGPAAFSTLIKPADAVQWVLYYPPLSDAKVEADVPGRDQCRTLPAPSDQACLTQRAEVLLRVGRIDDALRDVDDVLRVNPSSGDANALRSIIQVAKNDKAAALESANAATASSPDNMRAWLALSYAQQASFQLEQALESAQRAQALEPNSSLVNARVAELFMSVGLINEAEVAARAGVAANPAESGAHTMLGFVHLAQIDTLQARADFQAAIESDSFNPLARLGLGLAKIRDGELVQGRQELEIAVALDPTNSLLRSYVGKAYYEENSRERDQLAATQFDLAKQLDAHDPTPWFYEAILNDSQTRPARALQDLNKSADLNDDRAVYRSRQQLDTDLAARNASQATVYNELGFRQIGLTEAARSLAVDPGSGSAHRFLADIYGTLPRHDIARASELLQAQLRQPLGAPPLQAQLANDVAFRNAFFGPATVGPNEFNPLFIRNGNDVQIFALAGNNDTYGDQVIINGLHGPVSFSLSQFAAHTDGYRPNNDDTQRQYDGFLQGQFGANTSVQVEVTHTEQESGDLTSDFDPTAFSEVLRNDADIDTQRIGLRQVIDPHSDLLISVIRQDRHASANFEDPFFPLSIVGDVESWKTEAQYLMAGTGFDLILGAGYFDGESTEVTTDPIFGSNTRSTKPRHFNSYGYMNCATPVDGLQVQLGVSYDDLTSDVGDQNELNPKLGVIWKPSDYLTLRAAGVRVLKRRISSDQGLEPTQLAGFNQFFDDDNGTVSEVGGLAADFEVSSTVAAGVQATRRNLDVPIFDFVTNDVTFKHRTEKAAAGYFYWLPSEHFSVSLQPEYQDFEHGTTFAIMKLTQVPAAVRFFSSSGWWAGVSVTGVKQEGEFTDQFGIDVPDSDEFWVADAIVAYRLPRRLGTISLQGTNLFDETFQFQEIDLNVPPRYIPETQVLLRVSISL
jgi:tetratricopeptide (TPR) repeat protein